MSNWSFRNLGSFRNQQEVDNWAARNSVDPRDIKTRPGSDGNLDADVRESAYKDSDSHVFGRRDPSSGF